VEQETKIELSLGGFTEKTRWDFCASALVSQPLFVVVVVVNGCSVL